MPEIDNAAPTPGDALRARLATERLLTKRQRELREANSRIAAHARQLTEEIVQRRQAAAQARLEADSLRETTLAAEEVMRQTRSERRLAERRLWTSLGSLEDGFAVFDGQHRVVAANRAFFRPFAGPDRAGLGASYAQLVTLAAEEGLVDTGERSRADWIAWMVERWQSPRIEPVLVRFWNDQFVRLTESRSEDGDIVMVAANMTATIRREKALEEARRTAEAASRAKSAFLANMSHEIRTPMNGILAMAEILGEGDLDTEQALCIDTIRTSGEALLVIINDILDYSKIEAGKMTLTSGAFDLERTVQEVATLLLPSARGKGLSLVVDYDMFVPTGFNGDKGRIRQILMNLVGNAVKFTETGHVLIRIVGLPEAGTASWRLHVTVEDTGIGIPNALRDHVFGEFNQADGATTRRFDGTGLGLSITRRLINMMGGEVWLESEEGEGSVFGFRIVLPQDGDRTGPPDLPELAHSRPVVVDPDGPGRAVLAKQLMAIGLSPTCHATTIDALNGDPVEPGDIVMVAEDDGPAGRIRLGHGPGVLTGEVAGTHLYRPVLRNDLVAALEALGVAAPEPVTEPVTVPVAAAPPPHPPAAPDAPPVADAPPRAMRVLAAEDNATNRLVLTKLLKSLDISLEIVENGQIALDRFREEPPDILLTDISMPVMDGTAAAKAIRAWEAETGRAPVPIVAMTAHALAEQEEACRDAGFDGYLTKPLKKAGLAEAIAAAERPGIRPVQPD